MSWQPINFDRWDSLAAVVGDITGEPSSALMAAISRMRLSWGRLRDDLRGLFLPSGPEGSHAFHHFHAPADPEVRERVLSSCVVDYESSLVFLDVALEQSTACVSRAAGLPFRTWEDLWRAAERHESGLPTAARATILYLQRSPLYARNFAVAHPHDHLSLVTHDNVGNISFLRLAITATNDADAWRDLDALLHDVRPDIRADVHVGSPIGPHLALAWIGAVADQVEDWRRLNRLREHLGYMLPGPYEVAPRVNVMVDHFIATLPPSDFTRLAFAAGATASPSGWQEPAEIAPAVAIDEGEIERIHDEGVAAGEDGRHGEAVAAFRRVIDMNPENALAHHNLARALLALDDPQAALEHLQAATAIGGVSAEEVRPDLIRAHFNLAAASFNQGDVEQAVANYRRVCELSPSDVEAWRHLAVALARAKRVDSALLVAARLLREHEADPDVQYDVGLVLLHTHDRDRAIACIERALELRPGWGEAELRLAAARAHGTRA